MHREIAPRDGRSKDHRLARRLDSPALARIVPHLAPETLHQLIRDRGLDASGEILVSATPTQLSALLDLDLWRHPQPGPFDGAQGRRDEQFDVDRFGEWLEVLVEIGDSVAAHIIAALDKDLVIAGLSRYLRVFDPGIFEPTESSDDERMDRREMMHSETSRHVLECEVGGYLVRARRTDAWDAIVTLLTTLDTNHSHDFHALMQGCRRLSNSRPEIDGLDDLLTMPEQHLDDVARQRERRQSRRGYATPADARAFLQMARQSPHTRSASARTSTAAVNPIVRAYFRAVEDEEEKDAVVQLVVEASRFREHQGVTAERPRALLEAADGDQRAARLPFLTRLMEFLLHDDQTTYLARTREVAFLANTLLAGCSVQSRPFTPQEASDAAACICNLGLECWPDALADRFLLDHELVAAFELGWSVLYRDVNLFVADRLRSTLADLHCVDADTRRELRALERQLATQREAGTPWLARDAADVLARLDMTVDQRRRIAG